MFASDAEKSCELGNQRIWQIGQIFIRTLFFFVRQAVSPWTGKRADVYALACTLGLLRRYEHKLENSLVADIVNF